MEREIDLFADQEIIINTPQIKEEIPFFIKNSSNYTDIKSIFNIEGKEIPVYHIAKESIIYPKNAKGRILQNVAGLNCTKDLNEKGKTKKDTTTGLTQYQALEHYHLCLDEQYRSYSKDSIFSTYSRLAKRTPKSKK